MLTTRRSHTPLYLSEYGVNVSMSHVVPWPNPSSQRYASTSECIKSPVTRDIISVAELWIASGVVFALAEGSLALSGKKTAPLRGMKLLSTLTSRSCFSAT